MGATKSGVSYFNFANCKVAYTDASASIIGAIRKVLYILLDEWHVNQCQHSNVTATLRQSGSKDYKSMDRGLFCLRRTEDICTFRIRRASFEQKRFSNSVETLEDIRVDHGISAQDTLGRDPEPVDVENFIGSVIDTVGMVTASDVSDKR